MALYDRIQAHLVESPAAPDDEVNEKAAAAAVSDGPPA
jgi:hypothetical protein